MKFHCASIQYLRCPHMPILLLHIHYSDQGPGGAMRSTKCPQNQCRLRDFYWDHSHQVSYLCHGQTETHTLGENTTFFSFDCGVTNGVKCPNITMFLIFTRPIRKSWNPSWHNLFLHPSLLQINSVIVVQKLLWDLLMFCRFPSTKAMEWVC